MEKKSNLGWHIRFLDRYLREKISPQGLRIQVFPSFEMTDPVFKEEWEQNLNRCSANLISMQKTKYNKELNDLDKEIESLKASGHQLATSADFKKRENDLIQYLENYNKNIVTKKDTKFYKDKLAFSGGYAYRWPRGQNNRQERQFRTNKNFETPYRSDSEVSASSSVSSYKPPPKSSRGSHGRGCLPKRGNNNEHRNHGGNSKKRIISPSRHLQNGSYSDLGEGAHNDSFTGTITSLPMFGVAPENDVAPPREMGAVPKSNQGRGPNTGSAPLGHVSNPPATPMTQRTGKMDPFVIKQNVTNRD